MKQEIDMLIISDGNLGYFCVANHEVITDVCKLARLSLDYLSELSLSETLSQKIRRAFPLISARFNGL